MNLISSYFNPSISKPRITKGLKGKITSESPSIIWDSTESEGNNYQSKSSYSLDEVERVKQDFAANFGNLRKYPKMSDKDWE